ncbi:hypothetical protein [Burkholderia ubonensis]|uniref:hypothetical protein n=1 Tax=Burkholderia ubonensis TaxID=101571 RepID=UPI000A5E13C2|nr:hypothetical protein [Burkholderia ubonensis]
MAPQMTIDFRDIEGPIYSGRPRGESLRRKYALDDVDASGDKVAVRIPESTYSVTSSFFLGLFGPSVLAAGSRDKFFEKFEFSATPVLLDAFADYANRALQTKTLFARH